MALTSGAAEILGLGVGDVIEYNGLTPDEFERCWVSDEQPLECEAVVMRTDGPFPIKLDVVGLVRSSEDISGTATEFRGRHRHARVLRALPRPHRRIR